MAKTDRLSQFTQEDEIILHYNNIEVLGFFTVTQDEVLLYRILDISIRRTLWQRIFGVGTIILTTADQSTPTLEILNIKDSERVRRALSNIVEKERDEKRVLGKEMFGASHGIDDMSDHDIMDHFE